MREHTGRKEQQPANSISSQVHQAHRAEEAGSRQHRNGGGVGVVERISQEFKCQFNASAFARRAAVSMQQ